MNKKAALLAILLISPITVTHVAAGGFGTLAALFGAAAAGSGSFATYQKAVRTSRKLDDIKKKKHLTTTTPAHKPLMLLIAPKTRCIFHTLTHFFLPSYQSVLLAPL